MVHFASEEFGTQNYCYRSSRAYLCTNAIYLAAVVVPVLILYSIGNIWSDYRQLLVQPYVQISGYQATCLNNAYNSYYFSSFAEENSLTNGTIYVAQGASGTSYINDRLDVQIRTEPLMNLVSCSFTLYLNVTLEDKIKNVFVGIATFDTYSSISSSTQYIQSATVNTVIRVRNSKPLAMSHVPETALSTPYNKDDNSMRNSLARMIARNLTALAEQTIVKVESTASATSPIIKVIMQVPQQTIITENDLKSQLREFIRQYVFVFLPFLWIARIAVRWILRNRIYSTKTLKNYKLE